MQASTEVAQSEVFSCITVATLGGQDQENVAGGQMHFPFRAILHLSHKASGSVHSTRFFTPRSRMRLEPLSWIDVQDSAFVTAPSFYGSTLCCLRCTAPPVIWRRASAWIVGLRSAALSNSPSRQVRVRLACILPPVPAPTLLGWSPPAHAAHAARTGVDDELSEERVA